MKKLATILAVALATLLVASCGTSNTTSYCPSRSSSRVDSGT
jgi:ABC-type Fe3+-citrate transport system substrate-binding protein